MKKILVTGSAGFIGFHLCKSLLENGWKVLGLDALTKYYDVNLKKNRLKVLDKSSNFNFAKVNLNKKEKLFTEIENFKPKVIIHLAAQAGVRHSYEKPRDFVSSNIIGTFNLLEFIKNQSIEHFLFASSSSVYGANLKVPYKETDKTDLQLSFYAATKKSSEVMTHSYAHLYKIPTTAFRFFTVYGPWGRPDMAPMKFTRAILNNDPIFIYNYGKMERDFTFVSDLIEGINRLIPVVPGSETKENLIGIDSLSNVAPWRVVNIGSSKPKKIGEFITTLEATLKVKASKRLIEMQPGDVTKTYADISLMKELTGYEPATRLEDGLKEFVNWYKSYYCS